MTPQPELLALADRIEKWDLKDNVLFLASDRRAIADALRSAALGSDRVAQTLNSPQRLSTMRNMPPESSGQGSETSETGVSNQPAQEPGEPVAWQYFRIDWEGEVWRYSKNRPELSRPELWLIEPLYAANSLNSRATAAQPAIFPEERETATGGGGK